MTLLDFTVLWRDQGAERGLRSLSASTMQAKQGFAALKQASAEAAVGMQKARDAAAGAARRVAVEEQKLAELRVSGKAKASQLLAAENRLEIARNRAAGAAHLEAAAERQLASATKAEAAASHSAMDSVRRKSAGLQDAAAKAAGFGKALGAGAALAVGFGVKVASGNEQARISFTTMLGSAQKADAFLKQLQKFAATTPFEFPELQTAASSLISVGISADKVIPIMRTLGDVTSGMGTGAEGVKRATVALQQMNAAGRITGEDLNQLRDAGIPVYELLSKATGKSSAEVVKLAQAGKLGKKELGQMMATLESGQGLERFSGLMDKQSKSLAGLWSTLKDTFGQGMAAAIDPAMPVLKDLLGGITAVVGFVSRNTSVFVPMGLAIGGVAAAVFLANKGMKAWAITQEVSGALAGKAVGGLNLLKVAFTGVELTAVGAGRAMKIAQLAIPGVGIALFAVTSALQFFASKSDESTSSAADFSSAVESVKGNVTRATAALNDNVRAVAVNALQSKGAYEQAKLLGLSYGTVTDAALGNKDAITEVNRAISAAIAPSTDLSAAHVAAKNAASDLAKTMGGVARQSIADAAAENVRRGAMQASVAPTVVLTSMTGKLKDAQKALRLEAQKVIDKLTILRDGALSQDQANSAWQASIDAVSASAKANGRSLSANTEKGRANRDSIRNMITSLNDKVTSDAKASHSTKGLSGKMLDGEKAIRKAAKAAGFNKDEVDAMIRKMIKTPKQIATDIKTDGMKTAQDNVDTLARKIRNINGRTVTVRADFAGGGKATATANGHTTTVHFRKSGGVLPGYTPGRDVHMFHSPTAGFDLGLSGGEAILRPEATKAFGVGGINRINAAARSGGAPAVRQIMGFADGGVYRSNTGGPNTGTARNTGATVVRLINVNTGTSGSANIDANYAALIRFGIAAEKSMAATAMRSAAAAVALAAANDDGPIGGKGYANALRWARHQGGPYIFGGVGPRGYDCSGFMSAIDNVIHGRAPHHRLFSTTNFHGQANGPGGFHHNKRSPFMIGITNRGAGGGHMAGTLNGVNVESSGGRGAHTGRSARGWHNGLFSMHYGLARGGIVGDLPYDTINPNGQSYDPRAAMLAHMLYGTPVLHDRGGRIPPGDTLVRNRTSQPERVLTGAQNRAFENLTRVASNGGGGITINMTVNAPNYVGPPSDLKRVLQDMGRNGDMRAILASAGR